MRSCEARPAPGVNYFAVSFAKRGQALRSVNRAGAVQMNDGPAVQGQGGDMKNRRASFKTAMGSVLLWASLALVTGCGSVRPSGPPDALDCGLERFEVADIYSHFYRIRQTSFNVLALSAGGEFGAYGAGFLSGWRSVGASALPHPRDAVQVVTAVSTGSILATHAFLGLDAEIETLYRSLSGTQIYKPRSLLALVRANSLMDASGKDSLIETYLPSGLIEQVGAWEGRRSLFMGIVDLDSGRFMRIDMVKLAKTVQPVALRDACYRAVVGASSAIPLAFPPKFIDDMMLVDGGARRHLFITEPPSTVLNPHVARNLVSFVHGDLNVGCTKTENGVLQIAARSASIMTDQSFKDSIWLMDALAKAPASQDPGKTEFSTHYASAAAAARACEPTRQACERSGGALADTEDMFCRPFMNCLADRGKQDGSAYASGARPWLQVGDLNAFAQPDCSAGTGAKRTLAQ
jgi:hypothetical protein